MSDSEIKLFYAQNSEVSKRILAPDEHLRAIDTGAYYVAGPDGKPQAVLTATTSAQGVASAWDLQTPSLAGAVVYSGLPSLNNYLRRMAVSIQFLHTLCSQSALAAFAMVSPR